MAITKGVTGSGNNPTTSVNVTATLSGASTAGRTIIVGITCRNKTTTVTGFTDDSTGGPMTFAQIGGYQDGATNIRTSLWRTTVGGSKAGATVITATLSVAERDTVIEAEEWIGVVAIGAATSDANTNANPTIAIATQDANNYVVAFFGARGGTAPTALTGALDVVLSSEGSSQISGGLVSNTAASATTVTCAETLAAATWTVVAIELRSTQPVTVALTGVAATGSIGTLTPALLGVAALVGKSATGSIGTLTPSISGVLPIVTVVLGGVPTRVRDGSLTIRDVLNAAPNTAVGTFDTLPGPSVFQDLQVYVGALVATNLIFAGQVVTPTQTHVGTPSSPLWPSSWIDYTFELNRRRPFGTWVGVSATTIAQSCVTNFASGFTSVGVQASLPPVSIVFDGREDFGTCMARLATAIGGYYAGPDYSKDVRLFLTDTASAPDALTPGSFLNDSPISATTDGSQLRTRDFVKGAGVSVPSDVLASETIVPVTDVTIFAAVGSAQAITGSQVITYTGTQVPSGGSLVGPGAAPSVAPSLDLAGGAGLGTGTYAYAYSDVTIVGESLPSPLGTITAGAVAAPSTAPIAGTPTAGGSIDLGVQDYKVTFVTAVGETTPSAVSGQVTTQSVTGGAIVDPSSGPTANTPTAGGSVDLGVQDYVVTFTNAAGETLPSPASGQVTTSSQTSGQISAPSASPQLSADSGSTLPAGTYKYACTFVNAAGETTASPIDTVVLSGGSLACFVGVNSSLPLGPSGTTARRIYRTIAGGSQLKFLVTIANNTALFYGYDSIADGSLGANVPTSNTTGTTTLYQTVPLTSIPIGGAGTTTRKLYRRFNGAGTFKLVTTIGNNTATTYTDSTANASLGAAAPSSNTTATTTLLQTVPVSGIPTGGALVTSRKLYRRFNGAGTFKLVTTIGNNTATTFSDTVANGSLGAAAPSSNTATANQVSVSGIAPGASAVTSRNLYRTVVNGSQLKLLTTIANNTGTTFSDSTADGSLGANAPTGDTSGLTQPTGQVNAGSTTLLVASPGPFLSSGGWVINGQQLVRYTGISANTLTGVPASGPGAIQTTILYGSQVLPAAALTGVTGLGLALAKGAPINLWVQRDDAAAQALYGIHEFTIVDATCTTIAMCSARGDADLALYSRPILTITYTTRDLKTKSGKTVHVNLPASGLVGDFLIQDVTITIDGPALNPRFAVKASSVRFSMDDLYRRALLAAA